MYYCFYAKIKQIDHIISYHSLPTFNIFQQSFYQIVGLPKIYEENQHFGSLFIIDAIKNMFQQNPVKQ